MVKSKHLSNQSKSTATIALRTRKTSTQDNECKPTTSRKNDKTSIIETIKNVIKEVGSEEEPISNFIRKIVKEELENC